MRLDSLAKHFEAIGARVRFGEPELPRRRTDRPYITESEYRWRERARRRLPAFTLDVSSDGRGEYFDVRIRKDRDVEFEVLQSVPKQRHLLLMTDRGRRFLCGHDERHWFVAEIGSRVSSVRDAKRALLPSAVREQPGGIGAAELNSRKNGAFVRQGEWFFVPSEREFDESVIHRNEPIQRSRESKPHTCEELVREGGETVYMLRWRTYTESELKGLDIRDRRRARVMTLNPRVYVRGYVRHPDHRTIRLEGWHLVLLNEERSSSNLAFLD